MPAGSPTAAVAPSGQSIVLLARDSTGALATINSLASSNEVQSIRLVGSPTGNEFTLALDGQTTSEIPTLAVLPTVNLLWTFPVVSGHSYNVGVTWNNWNSTPTCEFGFDAIESGSSIAHIQHEGNDPPSSSNGGFADADVYLNNSNPASFLPVLNPSFEAPVLPVDGYTQGIPSWTAPGLQGVVHTDPTQYPTGVPDGVSIAWSNGGTISQVLTSNLSPGVYTLTVDIGARLNFAFGGYAVKLLAGSTVLAEDNNTLSPTAGTFLTSTLTYTALPTDASLGQALQIVLVGNGTGSEQTDFDNVQLNYNPAIAGTPAYWLPVNPDPLVASTSSMQLLFTASTGAYAQMSGVRVQDITANTITYYDCTDSSVITLNGSGWSLEETFAFHSYIYSRSGGGSGVNGNLFVINPGDSSSALVLQAALQSLSSIGSGNLSVVDISDGGTGTYQVTFTGSLANTPQALITCGDSHVAIAEINEGGALLPKLTINSGTPIPLATWIYDENTPNPYAQLPLPQSSPAIQTAIAGVLPCQPVGYDWSYFPDSSALCLVQLLGFTSGATVVFHFTRLAPGTYQFAITYLTTSQPYGNVTYQPSSATQFLVQDGSGAALATYAVDQTQAPADYESEGHGWKVLGSFTTTEPLSTLSLVMNTVGLPAQSDGIQQVATIDAVQLTRTSADHSIVIGSDDVVTIDIQNNWMTTSAGIVPTTTAISVASPSASSILPVFIADPKTLKAGMNVQAACYAFNFFSHSNLAYLNGTAWSGKVDSNGYPTTLTASRDGNNNVILPVQETVPIVYPDNSPVYGDPVGGTYQINPGKYILTWDGDESCSLVGLYGAVSELTVTKPSNVTGNWKVYDVTVLEDMAGPALYFNVQTTTPDSSDESGNSYLINLTNLAIYPPDPTDPTGQTIWGLDIETNIFTPPPKFHPWFLYKLQGMQSLRFLGASNTGNNACSRLSHYKPTTHADRFSPTFAYYSAAVSLIQAPPGGTYFVPNPSAYIIFQVTTTEPHGLYDGCIVSFSNCGTAEFSAGSVPLDTNTSQISGLIHVVDDTNIICYSYVGGNIGTAMTNTLTPASGKLLVKNLGSCWPLQDMVDLVVAIGGTDLWFNIPVTIDTSPGGGAYQVAAQLAAMLPEGIKLHLEVGNECWNYIFPTYQWCALKQNIINNTTDGHYGTYYANLCKTVHDQCHAAFTAAGRPDDLVRVFGTQAGNVGPTQEILTQAQSIGATIDELCIATYYNAWPTTLYTQDQCPVFDAMTTEQLMDYMELITVYGGWAELLVGNQVPVLASYGYSGTKMTAYEGGAGNLIPINPLSDNQNPPGNDPNYALRQNAVKRHPRMYGVTLQLAQEFQDAGLTLWNYFDLGYQSSYNCWDLYETGNMQRGTGNASVDTINVSNPQAKNQVLSEMGGGWHYWSTLSTSPKTTITNKVSVGHNGLIRSFGYPRGMFRTTSHH